MPQSIGEHLNAVFEEASQSYVRNALTADRDRAEFEAIERDAGQRQEELTRLYHEEYDARVDAARRRLYDEAARLRLDHPTPPGGGNDRAAAINTEARRLVRQAHEADLQAVRDEAQKGFEELLERAHRRNQTKGMAVDAFLRAGDRRSGEDRRTVKRSQD